MGISATQSDPRDLVTLADVKAWADIQGGADDGLIQSEITAVSIDWLRRTGRATLNSILPFTETYDGSGSKRQFLRQSPIISVQQVLIDGSLFPQSPDGVQLGWVIDDNLPSISIVGADGFQTGIFPSRGGLGFSGTNFRGTNSGPVFRCGLQNITVQYTAGYSLYKNEPTVVLNTAPYQVIYALNGVNVPVFNSDYRVRYANTGALLTNIGSGTPGLGQYTVNVATGTYTFSAADNNKLVLIDYTYNGPPADIHNAVMKMVALFFKRRKTMDLKMLAMAQGAGTTSYRDWEIPPEILQIIRNYVRKTSV